MKSHVESISLKVQNVVATVDILTNYFGMVGSQHGEKIEISSRDHQKFPSFIIEKNAKNVPQKDVAFDDITTVSNCVRLPY
jgi:hypothetical protein